MFEHEIEKGIAWLDEVSPGWEGEIDLAQLDIMSPYKCILGQLFLWEGSRYDPSPPGMTDYGFLLPWRTGVDCQQGYSILTEEWRAAIKTRLAHEV